MTDRVVVAHFYVTDPGGEGVMVDRQAYLQIPATDDRMTYRTSISMWFSELAHDDELAGAIVKQLIR